MVRMPGSAEDEDGSAAGGRAAERRQEHLAQRYGSEEPVPESPETAESGPGDEAPGEDDGEDVEEDPPDRRGR